MVPQFREDAIKQPGTVRSSLVQPSVAGTVRLSLVQPSVARRRPSIKQIASPDKAEMQEQSVSTDPSVSTEGTSSP